jgi:hypothetical protein
MVQQISNIDVATVFNQSALDVASPAPRTVISHGYLPITFSEIRTEHPLVSTIPMVYSLNVTLKQRREVFGKNERPASQKRCF